MTIDKYGEVVNSQEAYDEIADHLLAYRPVAIGWTDQHQTHLDILFTYKNITGQGDLQRGLKRNADLFVSIVGIGVFGFMPGKEPIDEGYYISKFPAIGRNDCSKALSELINGVRESLVSTYRIVDGGFGIKCLDCLLISYNQNDIKNKYCGCCYKFHEE